MEECEGVGYDEGVIGQGFASIVWDLVCMNWLHLILLLFANYKVNQNYKSLQERERGGEVRSN